MRALYVIGSVDGGAVVPQFSGSSDRTCDAPPWRGVSIVCPMLICRRVRVQVREFGGQICAVRFSFVEVLTRVTVIVPSAAVNAWLSPVQLVADVDRVVPV